MRCGHEKTACGPFTATSYRTMVPVGVISPARAVIRGTPSPLLLNSCLWLSIRLVP